MSYFEDFVEDGFACAVCGEMLDIDGPGHLQMCPQCLSRSIVPGRPKRRKKARRKPSERPRGDR